MDGIRILSLVTIAVLAALWDLKEERIPNALTASGFAMGCIWQLFALGPAGIPVFLGGALLPLLLFSLFYYFRMIGAGDIKLFMAAGAFLGAKGVLRCIFYTLLFAAVLALIPALENHLFGQRLRYLHTYLRDFLESGVRHPYLAQTPASARFCFAVPVLFGVLCSI